MRQLVRRLIAVMVGLVGAMALAGCDVTGTITVRADDLVDLVLRVIVEDGESCAWNLTGVRTSERRNRGGGRLCMLQGTVPAETLRRWGIDIAHNGEQLQAVYNPLGQAAVPSADQFVPLSDVAVTVAFPGQILESTGVVEGNTVRFTDVAQLQRPYGMRAVALDHAGPRWSLVLPAVTFAVGALGVAALWAAGRRRELFERSGFQRFFGNEQPRPDAPESLTTDDVAAAARPADLRAPGSLLPPDLRDQDTAGGPSGWERPGDQPDDADPPAAGSIQPAHAKWAPPDDPG